MSRSLNKVQLIGNLTRDPELRYTPSGAAVCTFGLATNRQWKTDTGEKKEDVEFHRVVAWNKLAEICAQLLTKGRKTFVEGRIRSSKWKGQDGVERTQYEINISDMIVLDAKGAVGGAADLPDDLGDIDEVNIEDIEIEEKTKTTKKPKKSTAKKTPPKEDDIPF